MTVNLKIFALKYKLFNKLKTSLEADKIAIKNNANITFDNYCKIQLMNCTKTTLDKNKVQELCSKYNIDINTLYTTIKYQRLDVDNIPIEVDYSIDQIFDILQSDINCNNTIKKLASKQLKCN